MTRYNSSTNYGSGATYGADAATEGGTILWQLLFDWNNDGTLDSANESDRLLNVSIDRGRSAYLAQQGRGFEHVRPGRMTLLLDNHDRRYDPRYASSPLYPNVKPGRKVYLAVVDLSAATTYVLFTGKIDDIVPMNAPGGGEVQIECVDYMASLNDQALSFGAASQNITLTSAFETLLSDAGYPGGSNLDADTQPVIVFGVTDQNAGQVAHELADAGMGTFFVDKYGRACYYGRNHTYPAATSLDQTQLLNEPVVTQPWADVYNHVTAIASRPIRSQPSIVYFLPGVVQLTAGVASTIDVDYSSSSNLAVSDYAVFSKKDGTGTDLTSVTTVTSDLGYNGGTVTVTCTSNGYLTLLEIRGRQWGTVEEKKVSSDATSKKTYGLRRFVLGSSFLQDPNYASNHAAVILAFAKDDRESVTVQIEGREDLQFGFDLMTPVALTSAALDINATYYVMGIRHEWLIATGQGVITTLNLSKIIADSTSVTAADVLNEPSEAPMGYEDPGGDPDTLGSLDSTDAASDLEIFEEGTSIGKVNQIDFIGSGVTAAIDETYSKRANIIIDTAVGASGIGAMVRNDFSTMGILEFSTEIFDTGSCFTPADGTKLTMSTAGTWLIGFDAQLVWSWLAAGTPDEFPIAIVINNSSHVEQFAQYGRGIDVSTVGGDRVATGVGVTIPWIATAGDYVYLYASEPVGTNMEISNCAFWVVKIA